MYDYELNKILKLCESEIKDKYGIVSLSIRLQNYDSKNISISCLTNEISSIDNKEKFIKDVLQYLSSKQLSYCELLPSNDITFSNNTHVTICVLEQKCK